jgi:monomeric isocitrate dehydrogenase
MIHKTEIEGHNLQTLANEIGDLRYDALQEFLVHLSLKIKKDGLKDRNRGRIKLANQLDAASEKIQNSADAIEKAWIICKPFT